MCHVCALQELSPDGKRGDVEGGGAEESRNSPLCVGFLAQRGVTEVPINSCEVIG